MSAVANTNAAPITELGRCYQTRQSADDAALRLALRHSKSGLARRVPFLEWAYVAKEGGPTYELCILVEGWGVREIPTDELARRTQAGLRREIDRLLECAQIAAARAKQLVGSRYQARHVLEAAEYRDRARELETSLVVNVARRAS